MQNALRDMTKAARNRLAQIREEAAAAAANTAPETADTAAPKNG